MKAPFYALIFYFLFSSCADMEPEISDELYERALLYLVFDDGPISQFYKNEGCVQVDSNRYYFSKNHYAVRKFWYGASIYQKGDTVGFFGGSCIFRKEVSILDRKQNQIFRLEASEFDRQRSEKFDAGELASFIPTDTMDIFNLHPLANGLEIYYAKNNQLALRINITPDGEVSERFEFWNDKQASVPSAVYTISGDSLMLSENSGDYKFELLLVKSDSSYELQKFEDSLKSAPVVTGSVLIDSDCE